MRSPTAKGWLRGPPKRSLDSTLQRWKHCSQPIASCAGRRELIPLSPRKKSALAQTFRIPPFRRGQTLKRAAVLKRGRQPSAKGAKTTDKMPPSQPAASSASAAAPQYAHGGAPHSHDRPADAHAAALEAVLDVYLNLRAAGQRWLPGGIEHNETRRELVLRLPAFSLPG